MSFYTPPLTGNETQHWFPTALAGLSVLKDRCVSVSVFMWAYSSPRVVLTNQAWAKSESVSEHSVTLTYKQQPSHPPKHCVDRHRPLNPLSEIEDSGTNMASAKKGTKFGFQAAVSINPLISLFSAWQNFHKNIYVERMKNLEEEEEKGKTKGNKEKEEKVWKSTADMELCRSMVWSSSMGTHVFPGDLCKMKESKKYQRVPHHALVSLSNLWQSAPSLEFERNET